jgi:hypothetical protein
MSDLRHLHDAFEELERRADAAYPGVAPIAPKQRRGFRLVPIGATVVTVGALAAGAVLLSPGNDAPPGNQAANTPTTSVAAPPEAPRGIPDTPDDLIAQFRSVLGDTATFEVTETSGGAVSPPPAGGPPSSAGGGGAETPRATEKGQSGDTLPGAYIKGSLTASGVKGGFDLQINAGHPGDQIWCDDPDRSHCAMDTLPDGSQLAIGQTSLEGGGVTYMGNLIRTDGTNLLIHVSNRADPKGAGDLLAPQPPFTTDQLKALVTSALWW